MTREDLAAWIAAYELVWRTPGTDELSRLFAPGASYCATPFDPPIRGLEAIAAFCEAERESADETFELTWEPVAVDGAGAVARIEVRYLDPPARLYRDLWIIELDGDGRCVAFEEWPFWPEQGRTALAQ